jgi:hypothetical protein
MQRPVFDCSLRPAREPDPLRGAAWARPREAALRLNSASRSDWCLSLQTA